MKRILTIIISCLTFAAFSQTVSETVAFADVQQSMGHHDIAIQAYKRALFFQSDDYKENIFHKVANSYYSKEDYADAAKYYDLAYAYETQDAAKTEITLKKSLCLLIEQDYSLALLELFSLDDDLTEVQKGQVNFYSAIAYFGMSEFDKSEQYFKECVTTDEEKAEIEKLFNKNAKIRLNPKTAKVLSMILPGLGQFYAGDIKNGLNSMLLAAGLVTLIIYTSIQFTIFDAIISVGPWYQRYYTGGFKKAEIIAEQKLYKKRDVIYRQIIDIIATSRDSK